MNAEWFKNEIKNWSPKLNWTNNEIVEMSKLLLEISKLNGGEIVWDCEKDLQIEKEYAIEKARNAIQSKMTLYTIFFLKHHFKFYSKKGKNIHLQPDFLVLHRFYPMLNLNFASSRELEKLPGIGKVTALRIIKMREKIGKFTNEEEILNVKGIRKYNFNKFKDKIYLSSDPPLKKILHTDIEAFLEEPNFTNYIVLLLKGICIDPYQNKFEFISVNPKKLVFLELQDILDQLKSDEKTKSLCTRMIKIILLINL
jgi:competence ComEA-like helix-hairpin-helix protein